jgi:hypothetical protein
MTDNGIIQSAGQPVVNPLPVSWLQLPTAPLSLPDWANFGRLTAGQIRCLIAQIGYDQSQWNYSAVGSDNQLGRYQFTPQTLEDYGLLLSGSVKAYGTASVNHRQCWTPAYVRSPTNSYANYMYNTLSLWDFLNNISAQEHLAYQVLYDLYISLTRNDGISDSDSDDVVAGMLSVAWVLGSSGAASWRQTGQKAGVSAFNSGRYAIAVLSS